MDFITGVGLGNAAIAATAAYGAKDKTFEEKFNERIKVYEDEKKSLEKMIEILKKEKTACESKKAVKPTKESEIRPAEPVPVTETAPVETNTLVPEVPVPEPEPPQPQPTVEPLNQEILPELPLQPEPAAAPILATAPTETNTLVPEVPVPAREIPQPQPTVEPLNEELFPELPLQPEVPLPTGPPEAPVAAAATRRGLYQRNLQDARQAAAADTVQFANIPSSDATVARPLPALPPRPPSSLLRADFNPPEERTTFTTRMTRSGRVPSLTGGLRKKKLRTRRATKQKNV